MTEPEYRDFVQIVIDNVKKNGFPEKKVAFPFEKLTEAAEKKEIDLDKVLQLLDDIQIAHVKTGTKIVFYAKDRGPFAESTPKNEGSQPGPFEVFGDMDPAELMAAAAQMMQNMSPEQLEAAKKMYESMSEEERAALIEQTKKLGLF